MTRTMTKPSPPKIGSMNHRGYLADAKIRGMPSKLQHFHPFLQPPVQALPH